MDRKGIYEGQTVITLDGDKLGKVILCEQDYFIVEKGMLFPKDYAVRYEYVRGGDEGHAILSLTKEQIKNGEGEIASPYGQSDLSSANVSSTSASRLTEVPASAFATSSSSLNTSDSFRSTGATDSLSSAGSQNFVSHSSSSASDLTGSRVGAVSAQSNLNARSVTATEELRVPLVEERMDVAKREVETGEVIIHKEVITELKQVTVPVTREEVRIERVAVSEGDVRNGAVAMDGVAFQDATIRVPIHEEQIEVIKRPVVREEIRVSKDIIQEQQKASAELRKEQVEITNASDLHVSDSEVRSSEIRSTETRNGDIRAS